MPRRVRFAANGVALVLEIPADSLPQALFWGHDSLADVDLAELKLSSGRPNASNGLDDPRPVALLPEAWTGWTGTAGLDGHRLGEAWSPQFTPESVAITGTEGLGGSLVVTALDAVADLAMTLEVEMVPSGLVRMRASVQNLSPAPYVVDGLQLALPVPGYADDVLDLAGRWAKERTPQRSRFQVGSHLREGRHGRTGADAAFVLTAGESGFSFDRGEVWGMHVAFSGNHRTIAERAFTGERLLLGGELLLPGEVVLAQDESYSSPYIYAAYGQGLDESAARIHEFLRARDEHPRSPRPVVMNVWEAVYFDHDRSKLADLAVVAAEVGVERFVLDDGWFGARRDDTAGLGDWHVSRDVWGEGGFESLVKHVTSLGMEFGLWFEPEMVNIDSDLARRHPEWMLQVPGRLPLEFRNQQVLDISHPGAFAYIRDSIVGLVREHGIRFIKWDHNRDLIDAGSTRTGRAGVHEQTLATYRLLREIREACPDLEIESCSSGGARIDLAILEHTDRVWASDCIDAHERQQIQRWTAQLLPPELVGSHVGAEQAHTTGRRLDLSFRAATALFGHFGIEWDLTSASAEDLAALTEWVDFYKSERNLIHTGRLVRATSEDESLWLHGTVSPDRTRALYSVSLLERPVTWPAGRVRLPGLDAETLYRVFPTGPQASDDFDPKIHPAWWSMRGLTLPGAVLSRIGIEIPALRVDHSVLIGVERVDSAIHRSLRTHREGGLRA
ncbi:alpha-galactosidase [Microbacterium sp. CFBP9034]|uniref:alpha-galactosidase n=1 Tax=Microbacterium sp. CFBP9034 TaxID=3096540 RepID=UPI002A6AB59B|nr:alpha-galactosidase [Microbacterium sp. CFBP9034]MDY0911178.1 alpha-galactosidase [Microbacterium sp. CFBP9034]